MLSHDFGELFRATYLVTGHDFECVFLMPPRLFAVNAESVAGRAALYRSLQDVLSAVDREAPDVVLLLSGYLYTVNNIFHVDTVQALVRELRGRPCRLVTSDPFQGLLGTVDDATFSDANPNKKWLTWLFAKLADTFRDVVHLDYVAAEAGGRTRVAFYNRHIEVPAGERPALTARLAGHLAVNAARPRWLFIMSLEDYATQVALHGAGAFHDLLLGKLRETAAAGRQPVLIAPRPCLDALGARPSAIAGAVVLPALPIDVFMTLVTEAEHVFYWNIFSNTTTIRVVNGLPFFAFDQGHMARSMPRLFELAAARHDCGEPAYLDQTVPLDPGRLVALAAVQERAMRGPREHFRRAPSPPEMLRSLLGAPP